MVATTGHDRPNCGYTGRRADGAGVYHLATGNGDVDGKFLEACGYKSQWIITEHDHVSELAHFDTPEGLFLESGEGGVDGLAAQGFPHGERLASSHLLAAECLMCHRSAEVAQRIHRIVARRVGSEAQGEPRIPQRAEGEALLGGAALQHLHHRV